jgi:hypothetical protein
MVSRAEGLCAAQAPATRSSARVAGRTLSGAPSAVVHGPDQHGRPPMSVAPDRLEDRLALRPRRGRMLRALRLRAHRAPSRGVLSGSGAEGQGLGHVRDHDPRAVPGPEDRSTMRVLPRGQSPGSVSSEKARSYPEMNSRMARQRSPSGPLGALRCSRAPTGRSYGGPGPSGGPWSSRSRRSVTQLAAPAWPNGPCPASEEVRLDRIVADVLDHTRIGLHTGELEMGNRRSGTQVRLPPPRRPGRWRPNGSHHVIRAASRTTPIRSFLRTDL